MVKLKKFIAAAAAAMGTVGVTAFAASTRADETVNAFHFDMGNEINEINGCEFSSGAIKSIEVSFAEALVSQGNPAPSQSQPLTMYVTSYTNTLPKYRVTKSVEFYAAADNYVKDFWYLSGQGNIDVEYYLCGICGKYNVNVYGM